MEINVDKCSPNLKNEETNNKVPHVSHNISFCMKYECNYLGVGILLECGKNRESILSFLWGTCGHAIIYLFIW